MTSTSGLSGASAYGPGTAAEALRTTCSRAVSKLLGFGAPAIEGYPVDNQGAEVDLTMAYVGTRTLFRRAGFHQVAETDSVLNGFPRVVMRFDLRDDAAPEAIGNTASSAGEG